MQSEWTQIRIDRKKLNLKKANRRQQNMKYYTEGKELQT